MKTAGSELVYGLKEGKLIYIDEAEAWLRRSFLKKRRFTYPL